MSDVKHYNKLADVFSLTAEPGAVSEDDICSRSLRIGDQKGEQREKLRTAVVVIFVVGQVRVEFA